MTGYHKPVLLHETIEGLNISASGIYVDATFGGGGHSLEILKHLGKKGKLYAFDQDDETKGHAPDDRRFFFIQGNFRFIENYLRFHGVDTVDGILADLGVSSHHFDEAGRGFSYRFDSPLDMRMNRKSSLTAERIVMEYDQADLERIMRAYGEVHNSRKLAGTIIQARSGRRISTTGQFMEVIKSCVPAQIENQYMSKVFQALRIEVNHEMESLSELLLQSCSLLKSGGRLAVISYHSLEDRMVKNFIRTGKIEGQLEKDIYGNYTVPYRSITHKPVIPTDEEIKDNSRARSAKLRIAEKN